MDRYEMQQQELAAHLFTRGWLSSPTASAEEVQDALLRAQAFWGIAADGWAGPVTQRVLTAPRVCGLPDVMPQVSELTKFPAGTRVTVGVKDAITGFSLDQTRDMVSMAIAEWNKLSGFRAELVTSGVPIVLLTVGRIDGAGRTLAWSELANMPQTLQKYDQHEPWKRGTGFVAAPDPYVDPLLVMLHELGHAWGLPHAPGASHVMSAIYAAKNNLLGEWERQQMIERYGQTANPQPAPGQPPSPPAADELIIAIPGARVVK